MSEIESKAAEKGNSAAEMGDTAASDTGSSSKQEDTPARRQCQALAAKMEQALDLELGQVTAGRRRSRHGRVPTAFKLFDREDIFQPSVISIGPFHYNKRKDYQFREMEKRKRWYLHEILSRKQDKRWLQKCCTSIYDLESKARERYSEAIPLEREAFVEMLVLDGCFIIELFLRSESNSIHGPSWQQDAVALDLLKFENQIPFFVLERLYCLVPDPETYSYPLEPLTLRFFSRRPSLQTFFMHKTQDGNNPVKAEHLLHLLHSKFIPHLQHTNTSSDEHIPESPRVYELRKVDSNTMDSDHLAGAPPDPSPIIIEEEINTAVSDCPLGARLLQPAKKSGAPPDTTVSDCLLGAPPDTTVSDCLLGAPPDTSPIIIEEINTAVSDCLLGAPPDPSPIIIEEEINTAVSDCPPGARLLHSAFIPSAYELREAGVKFEKNTDASSLFDVVFEKGVIKMPLLTLMGDVVVFTNFTAFEQLDAYKNTKVFHLASYAFLMECLLKNSRDVDILRVHGIYDGTMRNEDVVALFNKCGKFAHMPSEEAFYYAGLFHDVNEYCRRSWPKLRLALRRDYFKNPWAIISTIAAAVLLLLTFTQTFFSSFPKFAYDS